MTAWLLIAALAVAPTPQPQDVTAVPSKYLSTSEDLENSCSLRCAVSWTAEASSSSPDHPASQLDDDKVETAWVAAKGHAVGESITFRFPPKLFEGLDQVRFAGFMIIPGFAKTASAYLEYARPKTVLISWNGRPIAKAHLVDRRIDQFVTIPDIYLKPNDVIVVRVTEVFAGQGDGALAITAIVPEGAH